VPLAVLPGRKALVGEADRLDDIGSNHERREEAERRTAEDDLGDVPARARHPELGRLAPVVDEALADAHGTDRGRRFAKRSYLAVELLGCQRSSSSRKATYSPAATRIPVLRAAFPPRFSSCRSTRRVIDDPSESSSRACLTGVGEQSSTTSSSTFG
jgi:hypothetical protein